MTQPSEAKSAAAVLDAALEAIQDLRTLAATDFTSANCQGQRGADRTDAFYDAYAAVKKIRDGLPRTAASLPPAQGDEATIPGSEDMDARFAWLEAKAADMGYVLKPDAWANHPDSPHVQEAQGAEWNEAIEAEREARALAERAGIDLLDDHDQFVQDLCDTLIRFRALSRPVTQSAPAPEGAVAWLCAGEVTTDEGEAADWVAQAREDGEKNDIIPLYTHPAPSAALSGEEKGR